VVRSDVLATPWKERASTEYRAFDGYFGLFASYIRLTTLDTVPFQHIASSLFFAEEVRRSLSLFDGLGLYISLHPWDEHNEPLSRSSVLNFGRLERIVLGQDHLHLDALIACRQPVTGYRRAIT
jgi:hypothetical protein